MHLKELQVGYKAVQRREQNHLQLERETDSARWNQAVTLMNSNTTFLINFFISLCIFAQSDDCGICPPSLSFTTHREKIF